MTRSRTNSPGEGHSRIWVQSAMVTAVVFWAVDRQGTSDMTEIQARQQMHNEIQTLRAERDMLRVDSQAWKDQATQIEKERDQARERVRLSRVAELEASPKSKTLSVPKQALQSPEPSVQKGQQVAYALPTLEGLLAPGSMEASSLAMFDSKTVKLDLGEAFEMESAPDRVSFQSRAEPSAHQTIVLNEVESIPIELDEYQSALARTYAEGLWFETLAEVTEFECGSDRGLSRARCSAELAELLAPFNTHAVECILTGNARPDYVYGLQYENLPSHGVSLEEGALILCDTGLVNH